MGNSTTEPLSPAQAKQRLRSTARQLSVAGWVRERPYQSLGLAFLAGLLGGSCPRARDELLTILLRHSLRPRK